jgi:hypothetical protein
MRFCSLRQIGLSAKIVFDVTINIRSASFTSISQQEAGEKAKRRKEEKRQTNQLR